MASHSTDDKTYGFEVLRLGEGDTEETLDGRLERKAQDLGIEVERHPDADSSSSFPETTSILTSTSNSDSRATSMFSRISTFTDPSSLAPTTDLPASQVLRTLSRASSDQAYSIAEYDRHASQMQPVSKPVSSPPSTTRAHSRIKRGIRNQMRLIREGPSKDVKSCFVCHKEVNEELKFHTLPCSHNYCKYCLETLIAQTILDESKMPPECCGQAVPGDIVQAVLNFKQQMAFLDSAHQWIAQKEFDKYASREWSEADVDPLKQYDLGGGNEVSKSAVERDARRTAEHGAVAKELLAQQRTKQSRPLQSLRAQQILERDRFCAFERNTRQAMYTRYKEAQAAIIQKYTELEPKILDRQRQDVTDLENRQVASEIELRATLTQHAQKIQTRLKYMEAYFSRPGATHVTERDRIELSQQYTDRDNMGRLHQSRIDVRRNQQTKQMEQLIARQKEEIEELVAKQWSEVRGLSEACAKEEETLTVLSKARRRRCEWRWVVTEQLERYRLESENAGAIFAPMNPIEWPKEVTERFDGLEREDLARHDSPIYHQTQSCVEESMRSRDLRVDRALNRPDEALGLESQDVLEVLRHILELKM